MVVTHNYKPNWPDEVALARGDVILVMSKHEEERWFGRLQDGRRGYFPASCVMEIGQVGCALPSGPGVQQCHTQRSPLLWLTVAGVIIALRDYVSPGRTLEPTDPTEKTPRQRPLSRTARTITAV